MITVAHYWGIDEIGVFVVPAVVAVAALRWMERRAKASQGEDEARVVEEKSDVD